MKATTERMIFRWLHIIVGIPVVGYVYTPFEALPDFAWMVRIIFLPVLLVSGFWMWKGHLFRKFAS